MPGRPRGPIAPTAPVPPTAPLAKKEDVPLGQVMSTPPGAGTAVQLSTWGVSVVWKVACCWQPMKGKPTTNQERITISKRTAFILIEY